MLAAAMLAAACSDKERPPGVFAVPSIDAGKIDVGGGSTFDVGTEAAIFDCSGGEEAGICACKEIGQRPTSLYVVLDRSGSMAEKGDAGQTKWDAIRYALVHAKTGVLRALGGRVAVGLALFPFDSGGDGCLPGKQLFPLTTGSQKTFDKIALLLAGESPLGATPTAPTLVALASTIKALPQPAYVLLATDGAPNCGTKPCDVDRCSYNVERVPLTGGGKCDETINCCDASIVEGGMGWGACVDADATKAAVADLASAGVKTFVFGAPGSDYYAKDLDQLAIAGGTARDDVGPGEPLYYAVDKATEAAFAAALSAVAAKVVDSCVITLESTPEDPGITNVLLDGSLVAQDPVDGWAWTPDGKIELRGASCDRVKAGTVSNVQVAVGCKTVTK